MYENENKEKKKIKLTVAGNEFTVLSAEDEAYSGDIAKRIDGEIREMCKNGRVSITAAAILTAINLCDELNNTRKDMAILKKQLTEYLERLVAEKQRYLELEKENNKLRQEAQIYRRRLAEESPGINEDSPISPAIRPVRRAVAESESEEAAEDEGNQLMI